LSASSATSRRSAIGLSILGVLLGLVSLEILLRLYYGVAGDPGEEVRGWRNAAVVAHAEIVAIGDSQTYGSNAVADDAWPQQLGRMLHRSTYQMAHGGWGPGEYLVTLDEALRLRPKVILIGFYLGNDLGDAYARVYHTAHLAAAPPDPRLEALRSTDQGTLGAVRRAETVDPNFQRWANMRCDPEAWMLTPAPRFRPMGEILATAPPAAEAPQGEAAQRGVLGRARAAVSPLLRLSVLYVNMRRTVDHAILTTRPGPRDYGSPLCVHFRDGQLQTVFTAGERLALLDKTDPRITEGERISFAILQEMADRCRQAGIRVYVLIIPTKESAFVTRASSLGQREPYLKGEWNAEARVRSETLTFLGRAGIDVIDPLPVLQAVIASGVTAYPDTFDGHPIRQGYEAIARAVAARLQHEGFGTSP
jgi:hypothetical protein